MVLWVFSVWIVTTMEVYEQLKVCFNCLLTRQTKPVSRLRRASGQVNSGGRKDAAVLRRGEEEPDDQQPPNALSAAPLPASCRTNVIGRKDGVPEPIRGALSWPRPLEQRCFPLLAGERRWHLPPMTLKLQLLTTAPVHFFSQSQRTFTGTW